MADPRKQEIFDELVKRGEIGSDDRTLSVVKELRARGVLEDRPKVLAPGVTHITPAVATPASPPSGPKKQIPRPDPGLNLFERAVSGVDRGMQYLDRVHNASNAGINELTKGAHFATQADIDAIHTPNIFPSIFTQDLLSPQKWEEGVAEFGNKLMGRVPGIQARADRANKAADTTFAQNKKVGLTAFSSTLPPGSSTAEHLVMRAMDLSADVQTDPVALLQGLGAMGLVRGAAGGAKLAKMIPAVQKGLAKANAIVDPLAASAARSEAGAFITRVLGNFGGGPHQAMRRELIRPHELEIANAARPTEEVLSEVQRETLRLRKAGFDNHIQDYAAQHEGANPVEESLRKVIQDRMSMGKNRVPFNQLTPKQKGALVKRYDNPFGISPTWLIDQADKTLTSMDATEFGLMKAGVKSTVNKGGAAVGPLDREKWLEDMFGKPAAPRPSTPGAEIQPRNVPTQMREAGIRNFINDLPQHTDWVRPVTTPGVPDPGWVEIPQAGLLGSKLGGMQVPAPLKAFLDTEIAAGGLGVSNEPKSWYIQNKDWIEWIGKNAVGTVKKGLIAASSTQNANLFSNQIVSSLALKSAGIDPEKMNGAVIKQAWRDVKAMQKSKTVAKDIQEVRQFSNSFDATERSTNFFGGKPRPAMEGEIIGAGQKWAYREPTLGEAAGALNPANHVVDFQGTAEQTFKLALYRTLKAGGKSPKEAAALMEKYMFDYSDRGPLLEIADKFGIWPFATYPTKAFGLLMDTIVHHPEEVVKYPRLRELAFRGYEQGMGGVDPRYQTAFTFPYGKPEDKKFVDMQRYIPLGAGIEGLSKLSQGEGLASALMAGVGLGRAGGNPLESAVNAPLGARLYGIAQGISPFSEAGKPKGMLQAGEPPSDLAGLQMDELRRNFAPSQFGGRGTMAQQDVSEGKTPTNYPFSVPKTQEEVNLQYGAGVRTFSGKTPTEKKGSPEVKEAVKSRKGVEVKQYLQEVKGIAKKDRTSRDWLDMKKDADKFVDPGMLKNEIKDAKTRSRSLPLSGRVVVDGKLTDEGRRSILRQALYLEALIVRAKEMQEMHRGH